MQAISIPECSPWSILPYFPPSFSCHLLFILSILSGRLRQVLCIALLIHLVVGSSLNVNPYHDAGYFHVLHSSLYDSYHGMYKQAEWKTVWILISWLLRSQLIRIYTCFQNRLYPGLPAAVVPHGVGKTSQKPADQDLHMFSKQVIPRFTSCRCATWSL